MSLFPAQLSENDNTRTFITITHLHLTDTLHDGYDLIRRDNYWMLIMSDETSLQEGTFSICSLIIKEHTHSPGPVSYTTRRVLLSSVMIRHYTYKTVYTIHAFNLMYKNNIVIIRFKCYRRLYLVIKTKTISSCTKFFVL